jgi:hypothetical protein
LATVFGWRAYFSLTGRLPHRRRRTFLTLRRFSHEEVGTKETAAALVWIVEGVYVRPVHVRKGLTDGARTEVHGDGLSENVQVIVGIAQPDGAGGGGIPFIPQLPGKKKS